MKEKINTNIYYLSWILIAILSLVFFRLVKLYDVVCTVLGIVTPVLFGYILAWILNPILKRMKKHMDSKVAIGIMIVVTVGIYSLLIWKLLPLVIANLENMYGMLNTYLDKLQKYEFLNGVRDYASIDMDTIISSCSNLVNFFIIFGLVHLFGFYILYNYDQVNSFLRALIPLKYKRISLEYLRKMSTNMRAYIKGTLIDTLILFLASSILYFVIGLDYPIMLGFFSAITNIIPFVGPYIGGVPAVMVGLAKSMRLGLATLGVIILCQTVESNIINPMIMSKCIKVNPILIILSLSIMGKFFGLFGMIFAVPSIIIFKLTVEFIQKYRKVAD